MRNKKEYVNFIIIILLFPICIFLGKYIRYSFMKTILVDVSIGHRWLSVLSSNYTIKYILGLTIAGEQNGTAIVFYKLLNFFNLNSYIEFEIAISFIFNIILFIMFFKCRKKIDLFQTIFLLTTIVLLNLFCFCLSKEPIQILFFILIYYVLLSKRNNKKEFWALSIVTFSALLFRKYYILIVYFYLATKIFINHLTNAKEEKSIIRIMALVFLIALGYMAILIFSQKFFPSYYEEFIRVRTRVSDASTTITNIFNTDNILLFVLNYIIIIFRMLVPIELLSHGPKYILYFFYQIMVTYSIIKNIIKYKNNSEVKNIALLLYIGFLFTSATFEPDFGSWIRHEVVLFPVMFIINDLVDSDKVSKNRKIID